MALEEIRVASEHVERKLAAILVADVAGYSRLMGNDEAGTVKALRGHMDALRPIIASHGGRIVDTAGDGLLLEFPSIVAAVQYAVAAQKLIAERNADVPEDRRMLYRVGINLGDVIVEGAGILGDGVNVAARLESIASPGGICLSEAAYQQVRGKVALNFVDMGEQQLKNISRPVRAYAVMGDGLAGLPVPAKQPSAEPAVTTSPARRYLRLGAALVVALVASGVAATWWSEPSATRLPNSATGNPDVPPAAPSAPTSDAIVWNVIKDSTASDPFAAFLRTYPESQYAAAARDKLAELAHAPPATASVSTPDIEGMVWAMIKDSAATGPFEEYLRSYPSGAHADAARAKLAARAKPAERAPAPRPTAPAVPTPVVEEVVWATVKDSTSVAPFEEYLRNYPNGAHAGAARAKLAELSHPPPARPAVPPAAAAGRADQARPQATASAVPPAPAGQAPSPAAVGGADQARPQSTALAAPPVPATQGLFDGRWQGDTPPVATCGAMRMQFEVTGTQISGTGQGLRSATVTGTIGADGAGTLVWGQHFTEGTIKFTGDGFEARFPGLCTSTARIFSGGRAQ